MKALSLWQPWATLVALGAKKIETRSWATGYRGPLVIHASARTTGWGWRGDFTPIESGGIQSGFRVEKTAHGLDLIRPDAPPIRLPLGAFVAVTRLANCVEMTEENIAAVSEQERALGHYEPGRFMWMLESVLPVANWHCVGRQGLFNLPADLAARIVPSGRPR